VISLYKWQRGEDLYSRDSIKLQSQKVLHLLPQHNHTAHNTGDRYSNQLFWRRPKEAGY